MFSKKKLFLKIHLTISLNTVGKKGWDPDPNFSKFQDPDPNLDPQQHCFLLKSLTRPCRSFQTKILLLT